MWSNDWNGVRVHTRAGRPVGGGRGGLACGGAHVEAGVSAVTGAGHPDVTSDVVLILITREVVTITNATKGLVIAVINAVLGLLVAFGVDLSAEQIGAILAVANTAGALFVALTYKNSPKRVPDDAFVFTPEK